MPPTNPPRPRLLLAALVLLPLAAILAISLTAGSGPGADEQARQTIETLHAYRPWFAPLWTPSPAAEPWLFLAQAAAGAGLLLLAILRLRARRPR